MTTVHEVKASFILMKESAKNLITDLERKLQKEIQTNGEQTSLIFNNKEFSWLFQGRNFTSLSNSSFPPLNSFRLA